MNKQRQAFYARRLTAMSADDEARAEEVQACVEGYIVNLIESHWPQRGEPEDDEYVEMRHAVESQFGVSWSIEEPPFLTATRANGGERHGDRDELGHAMLAELSRILDVKKEEGRQLKEEEYASLDNYPAFNDIVRDLQLQILDNQWKAHLHTMDALRESINLRGYAQRDPKIEYQREGFGQFGEMEQRIDDQVAEFVFRFDYPRPNTKPQATARRVDPAGAGGQPTPANQAGAAAVGRSRPAAAGAGGVAGAAAGGQAVGKVGRNDPCPCGSGQKYKKCHGS